MMLLLPSRSICSFLSHLATSHDDDDDDDDAKKCNYRDVACSTALLCR